MFHALGNSMRPRVGAPELRRRIMDHMVTHPRHRISGNTFAQWIRYDTGLSLQQYTRRMQVEGWGGGIELMAFHAMTGSTVQVYEKEPGGQGKEEGYRGIAAFGPPAARPIALLYQGRMHYDLLLPQKRRSNDPELEAPKAKAGRMVSVSPGTTETIPS